MKVLSQKPRDKERGSEEVMEPYNKMVHSYTTLLEQDKICFIYCTTVSLSYKE